MGKPIDVSEQYSCEGRGPLCRKNWTCEATPEPPLTAEDRESFRFLRQRDPHFTLRLHHASVLLVNVVETGTEGRLILTAAETDTAEPLVWASYVR
ncbi:hypothetical protein [Streptomyces sp. NBC_01336]|uniref:hypothetical protein n=1 Tax=unclassified Streptomyces TaxID=2593676 RepID=UPI002E148EAA|nr:hypothetical protein OG471_22385 [Streptomyces sp. NBC_01336]